MRLLSALAVAVLVVVAGCAMPVTAPDSGPAASTTPGDDADGAGATPDEATRESPADGTTTGDADETAAGDAGEAAAGATTDVPPEDQAGAGDDHVEPGPDLADPAEDVLGWENGVWYNESVDVNQSDGLSDAELRAYVNRTMARVERIRNLEFRADVPVEVITREEYRSRPVGGGSSGVQSRWNNQVWEALFVVDGSTDVSDKLDELYGSAVLGYYSPGADRLVIVSDGSTEPVIDNATLAHELVHALQDQQFDLTDRRYAGRTQDAELAGNGLTEGEANYVQAVYTDRCGVEWRCVKLPPGAGFGGATNVNLGLLLTVLQPYSDGPVLVHELVEDGGWAAVDELHEDPPATTEQVIHRELAESPVPLAFEDEARNGWRRYQQGVRGGETVGEAGMAVMFWYQRTHYRIDVAEVGDIFDAEGEYDRYDYNATPSAGWGNDRLVPYRNGDRNGYVWVTEWDTERDAREFHDAYRKVLAGHGAEQYGERTWVIPDGGYADAFHVVRDGTRVTVVNAPAVEDLADLRPSITVEATNETGG